MVVAGWLVVIVCVVEEHHAYGRSVKQAVVACRCCCPTPPVVSCMAVDAMHSCDPGDGDTLWTQLLYLHQGPKAPHLVPPYFPFQVNNRASMPAWLPDLPPPPPRLPPPPLPLASRRFDHPHCLPPHCNLVHVFVFIVVDISPFTPFCPSHSGKRRRAHPLFQHQYQACSSALVHIEQPTNPFEPTRLPSPRVVQGQDPRDTLTKRQRQRRRRRLPFASARARAPLASPFKTTEQQQQQAIGLGHDQPFALPAPQPLRPLQHQPRLPQEQPPHLLPF